MSGEQPATPRPKNGVELADTLGVRHDEGVVIAVLPAVLDEITTQEIPYLDSSGARCHVILADCAAWGERAVDVVSLGGEAIKWWKAKEAISAAGKNPLPIRWQGPVGEIPQQYFENGYVLAVRFYQFGPFFFPLEQPQVRTDTALLQAVGGADVDQSSARTE